MNSSNYTKRAKRAKNVQIFCLVFTVLSFAITVLIPTLIYFFYVAKLSSFVSFVTYPFNFLWLAMALMPMQCGLCAYFFGVFFDHLSELASSKVDLKILALVQIRIFEAINAFNKCNLFLLAPFLATNAIGSTFALYEVYDLVMFGNIKIEVIAFTLMMISGTLCVFMLILMMLYFINSTMSRFKKFEKSLHADVFENRPHYHKKRVQVILMQLSHTEAKFSCGMFEFDWKIITTVRIKMKWFRSKI